MSSKRGSRRVSYILRSPKESQHRFGINSLTFSPSNSRIFSAGRDASIRCWDASKTAPSHLFTLEDHTDWVNDIVLLQDETSIASCSSDTTVKLWRLVSDEGGLSGCNGTTSRGTASGSAGAVCQRTLVKHTDYVKALAYSNGILASAALDTKIILWDIEAGSPYSVATAGDQTDSSMPLRFVECTRHKDSVYSVAINASATVLASGSTDKVVRIWDPRSGTKQFKLKGHTDNIRCLCLNHDGTLLLSGSSDATVMLWDVGQQRCVHSYDVHSDSVWAMVTDASFSRVFSGARDGHIYVTQLASSDSTLLVNENAPVQKIALTPTCSSLWVATTDSSIRRWDMKEPSRNRGSHDVVEAYRSSSPLARTRSNQESASEQLRTSSPLLPSRPAPLDSADPLRTFTPINRPTPSLSGPRHALHDASSHTQGDSSPRGWGRGLQEVVDGYRAASPAASSPRVYSPLPRFTLPNAPSFTSINQQLQLPSASPMIKSPSAVIPGLAGIVKHSVLNNRRQVVTKDTAGHVAVWDITQGSLVDEYGVADLDDIVNKLNEIVSVPSWYSLDSRLGSLSVHLQYPSVFNAEIYAQDAGLVTQSEDVKVNIGEHVLRSLFSVWLQRRPTHLPSSPRARDIVADSRQSPSTPPPESLPDNHVDSANPDSSSPQQTHTALPLYPLPPHTPLIISDDSRLISPPLVRKLLFEFDGTEQDDVIPSWVIDPLINGKSLTRDVPKIHFVLVPAHDDDLPVLAQNKLSAPRILRIKKVIAFIISKLDLDLPRTDASPALPPVPGAPSSSTLDSPSTQASSSVRRPMPSWAAGPSQGTATHVPRDQQPPPPAAAAIAAAPLSQPSSSPEVRVRPENFLEVLCNDQVLSPNLNLMTVKHFYHKNTSDDLLLKYRRTPRVLQQLKNNPNFKRTASSLF